MTPDLVLVIDCARMLNPGTIERARRLAFAVQLLERGATRRDAVRRVREFYGCDRVEAWRLVTYAAGVRLAPDGREPAP